MKRVNKQYRMRCLVLVLAASSLAWAATAEAASRGPKRVSNELLVQVKAGLPQASLEKFLKRHGAREIDEIAPIRVKKLKVPARAISAVKSALSRNPNFTFVEYNYLAKPAMAANDPYFAKEWHLQTIAAPQGWDISTGAAGVTIAVADSGADATHPDLAGKLVPGYNFNDGNTDTTDTRGHGTTVAGVAAAASNNGTGVAGVAWNNMIMPLRISDATGYATYYSMAQAITYAADHGVRIFSISLGGTGASTTLQNAVNYAWNKGTIVIAAAMNSASSTPVYPAACDKAVAVAATTSTDTFASFSNFGNWIDLSAPGSGVYTTALGGGYICGTGTSFSAPIVAATAALVISVNPSLSSAQVVDILKTSADDLGAVGFDPYFGHGRVNVERSLLAAMQVPVEVDSTPPSVSVSSPVNGATVGGRVTAQVTASDDVGVAQVELHVDGAPYAATATAPYSFLWDTTNLADGTHTLEALARDAAGNEGWSARLTLTVRNAADMTPPTVAITSPSSGSTVGRKVTVTVRATDNVAATRTELYIDGVRKSSSTSGSLSYSWSTAKAAAGPHTIKAQAFDAAGLIGTSTITVYK